MLSITKNPWLADEAAGLPAGAMPVGYAWMVRTWDLEVMPHFRWSFVARAARQSLVERGLQWESYPMAYAPIDLMGHLDFALRYDGVNLEILSALFRRLPPGDVERITSWCRSTPTGASTRRTWFLYETLTGRRLDLADLKQGNYLPLLDPESYYTGDSRRSARHRVVDNLLGVPAFAPVVRRTAELARATALRLDRQLAELLGRFDADTLLRAAHWLYHRETRSSFAIERETPSADRAERFVAALRAAADLPAITADTLVRLQNLLVDPRFRDTSWRESQNYVAGDPRVKVDFVSPRPEDLGDLMSGWLGFTGRVERAELDPVIAAAAVAFSFVFLHPFEDGNGRIHRFLIHYMLVRKGFTPRDTIVPVSATMLAHMREYDTCLERYSVPLMARVRYELDSWGHLDVLGESAGLYRYPDLTAMAEALYGWMARAVQHDFRAELEFLQVHGEVRRRLPEVVDLPERLASQLVARCLENDGRLSNKRRKSTFPMLTDDEVAGVEALIEEVRAGLAQPREA